VADLGALEGVRALPRREHGAQNPALGPPARALDRGCRATMNDLARRPPAVCRLSVVAERGVPSMVAARSSSIRWSIPNEQLMERWPPLQTMSLPTRGSGCNDFPAKPPHRAIPSRPVATAQDVSPSLRPGDTPSGRTARPRSASGALRAKVRHADSSIVDIIARSVATNQALSQSFIWTDDHLSSLLMAFPGTGNKGVTSTCARKPRGPAQGGPTPRFQRLP
jgi:hypothetical protein